MAITETREQQVMPILTSFLMTSQFIRSFYSPKMTAQILIEQRANIKLCVLSDKSKKETLSALKTVYQDRCLSKVTVYQWYHRYSNDRESLDDNSRCGRPRSSINLVENRLIALLNVDRRLTIAELSSALDISEGSVHDLLHNRLKVYY